MIVQYQHGIDRVAARRHTDLAPLLDRTSGDRTRRETPTRPRARPDANKVLRQIVVRRVTWGPAREPRVCAECAVASRWRSLSLRAPASRCKSESDYVYTLSYILQ